MIVVLVRGCNARSTRSARCEHGIGPDSDGFETVPRPGGEVVLRERQPPAVPVIGINSSDMSDPNEIRALKASLRGALDTAGTLASLQGKIEALDEHGDIGAEDLEELGRVTAAHAIASAALRGLVNTMQTRRGASTT
jgi:hypothetical protein